ncbi:hypothetical protein [Jidongwangia harbinensis]|uniref:hypothetical protein n=1 Tax=Jidongwangia harbinensis TaxID=2878561 RepID=UPI001CD9F915|nr:hypothetical protein [Jidongwangia harbinensis]MCA2217424.1 hypothetical protein [Jidongwangia harbinensis]
MRSTVLRTTVASMLLAGAVALPAAPAAAAAAGPHLDLTPPAVVGAGLNPADIPVEVVNTGGEAQSSVRLRLTVTPVAGSAVRPLDSTLLLTYQFGHQWRSLSYETRGDTLVATTPALSGVDADGTTTLRLQVSTRPTGSAPHVDEVRVNVATEALDGNGAVFATDPAPDTVALVEPRAELTGWPERLAVGTPAVVTVTLTNTTPLAYSILRPGLAMYRAGNDQVVVERLDGDEWTPVSGPSSSYNWWYADGYPSLQPGETYSAKLRVTFTDDAAAGEQGHLYHIGYTYFGYPIAVAGHPYTLEARAVR